MPPRAKPGTIEWPLNAQQAESIDTMFQELYDDVRNGSLTIDASQVITGILDVNRGGTGTGDTTDPLTPFTAGSIVFAGPSGIYTQDNAMLFWDDTNNRLGVGTATPGFPLHVVRAIDTFDVTARLENTSAGSGAYSVFDMVAGTNVFRTYMPSQGVADQGAYVGTSSANQLNLMMGNAARWSITTSGHLIAFADNTYDFGASLTTRPRTGYFATSLVQGGALALGAVSTDGIVEQNTTAATVGIPVQQSPRLRFRSNVWNTTATAATNTDDWFVESVPASGLIPSGLLKIGSILNGAAATFPLTLSSAGVLTSAAAGGYRFAGLGGIQPTSGPATSVLAPDGGAYFRVLSGTIDHNSAATTFSNAGTALFRIPLPTVTGLVQFNNGAGTTGVGIDVATDAVLKVRVRAHNAYATVDALAYQASGTPGVSGGAGFPSSITAVNGIITALTIGTGALDSGVYTPGLTNVANLAASTAYECQWMRVGNTVTVTGKVDIDPTLTATVTQLGIALPVASNIGAVEDCAGVAAASGIAFQCAAIIGDAANNRAQLEYISGDVTNQPMYFSFSYQVI